MALARLTGTVLGILASAAVLIVAVLAVAGCKAPRPYSLTAVDRAWFAQAAIGDTTTIVLPAGDGCNTCSHTIQKASVSTIRFVYAAGGGCTLLACSIAGPEISVAPEPK